MGLVPRSMKHDNTATEHKTDTGRGDIQEYSNLMQLVNIAVCGARGVGKSALIDGFFRKHVTGHTGATTTSDGQRYLHPDQDNVALYEIDIVHAATKDFRGFQFVFILFDHSATKLECETAQRAHERDIPIAFVGPKADVQAKRLTKLYGVDDVSLPRKTRDIFNSKASKEWFALPEQDRAVYIVSNPALFEPENKRRFDETALLNRFDYIMGQLCACPPTVEIDMNTGNILKSDCLTNSTTVMISNTYLRKSSRPLQASTTFRPSVAPRTIAPQAVAPQAVAISSTRVPDTRTTLQTSKPAATWQSRYKESRLGQLPNNAAQTEEGAHTGREIKIAFLEAPTTDGVTVMETVLGYKAGTHQSILSHTPYKHPQFEDALFFYIPLVNSKDVPLYFANNGLPQMRLIVLVFSEENHLQIVKEARRRGIDVVVASKVGDEKSGGLNPKKAVLKLRKIAGGDASQKLAKKGLNSVSVFSVNPRILRIPNSYPQTDEEQFKAYIAQVCKGKTPCSRYQQTVPNPKSNLKGNAFDGSSIFQPGDFTRGHGYVSVPAPKPALKADTPKSVMFDCRKDTLVAYVGAVGVGKTTLVRHTLGAQAIPPDDGGIWSVRHPAYYDVIMQDYPGYDPYDQNVGSLTWMHQSQLHAMDWIILVFNEVLDQPEINIIQFALNSNVRVVCVATKTDLVVDRFIFDKNLTEASAIDNTRSVIFQQYWQDMEAAQLDPPPLFILSGRALESKKRAQFDEEQYTKMSKHTPWH
ncbi:hypothetical protein GNI_086310 [Gregarina niphandrodes]|uniref:Ras family protein n=1 Tax=Gregarina niphandrodes TaxID=110365 RepID=A0A023B688_GRENI|nr:hypothetical protein GNI_086310 [Gregarina niphandrodes]EZG63929.1 hypothetical protein GNI_086310 [Gregarina niphandrodes]|eukprot:XP_011130654.1 hypothetical protein GNI_086310 [Gregarina niphandrodes]